MAKDTPPWPCSSVTLTIAFLLIMGLGVVLDIKLAECEWSKDVYYDFTQAIERLFRGFGNMLSLTFIFMDPMWVTTGLLALTGLYIKFNALLPLGPIVTPNVLLNLPAKDFNDKINVNFITKFALFICEKITNKGDEQDFGAWMKQNPKIVSSFINMIQQYNDITDPKTKAIKMSEIQKLLREAEGSSVNRRNMIEQIGKKYLQNTDQPTTYFDDLEPIKTANRKTSSASLSTSVVASNTNQGSITPFLKPARLGSTTPTRLGSTTPTRSTSGIGGRRSRRRMQKSKHGTKRGGRSRMRKMRTKKRRMSRRKNRR
jgi:hypothetical protein